MINWKGNDRKRIWPKEVLFLDKLEVGEPVSQPKF
jgi:hypothetical protein